jgi:uncharacterized SAM-binding protein YcdF (DUF218 family)
VTLGSENLCYRAGTAHKPRWRDAAGFAVPEAEVMAAELRARGVPLSAVVLEVLSDDTLGNAFAARALHTEWREDWRRLVLITSDFQVRTPHAAWCVNAHERARFA